MKKLILYLVGAMFLFVSCQSDLLESDDAILNQASKSDKAVKVKKDMTFKSNEGIIEFIPNQGNCTFQIPDVGTLQFVQTGGGVASHIGQYTVVNTACVGPDGLEEMLGIITAANGDEIYTRLAESECESDQSEAPCIPGENVTFTYEITGGSGRFEGASGWIYINGPFVPAGPYTATGWAEIEY